ncbi:phage tail tube protein [Paraburkholderia sp. J8-2]|uniref:phage tail tube protein n=1 Tax=Paraburkholderia sp. J8-2 TaxID=2805440 RepID=UPI002AB6B1EC|nr:phage tail tube protein [Paraburkholderia sp. J8-2]
MSSTAISAQGSRFFINSADSGAQATWTPVRNLKSFSGFDGTASELDVTDLDSVAKEKMLGLVDNGSFSLDVNRNLKDPGQAALKAAQVSSTLEQFKLRYPDGSTETFSAYVKSFPISGGVDAVMTSTVALTISGAVVSAETDDAVTSLSDEEAAAEAAAGGAQ